MAGIATTGSSPRRRHGAMAGHWSMAAFLLVPIVATIQQNGSVAAGGPLTEQERVAEYDKHYRREWPPKDYVPNTVGWRTLHEHRFQQIREIDEYDQKYEGYMQSVFAAFLVQNFTELGFGLARGPPDLTAALQEGIRGALERGEQTEEAHIQVIEGELRPWFIRRPDLMKRALDELQPYTETWAGMELTPAIAYGFRLYRDGAVLNMHVDKKQTHIISMIYHIDSESEEPWPIYIEDLQGRTHEVILTPGDILFYESSKCLHGRPKPFKGKWYSSIFIHYYPTNGWQDEDHQLRAHYIVPPNWSIRVAEKRETPLQMIGTSFKEPDCPNGWCSTQNTIKWSGPGEDGFWIDPNMQKHIFQPRRFSAGDDL